MAAKKKKSSRKKTGAKAKKGKKPAKKTMKTKLKAAPKRKAAPKKKAGSKRRKIVAKLAPTVERMKMGATEMGQGALDAGRMLFGEARDVGKEELDKAKEITTDWINRVT